MPLIAPGIATTRADRLAGAPPAPWLASWLASRTVASPAVLVSGPVTRRRVARMVRAPGQSRARTGPPAPARTMLTPCCQEGDGMG